MNRVLIVDDSREMCDLLAAVLEQGGYKTDVANDGASALKAIAKTPPDIILLDLRLPGMDGLTLLAEIKKASPANHVIMLTGHGGIKDAVKAMQLGAFDFVGKPFNNDELLLTIKRAGDDIALRRELASTRLQLAAQNESVKILGNSSAIQTVLKQVRLVAPTAMTVVLQGESGVGKEVIANLIHRQSHRRDKPFVPVDCGAIPDPLTESILFGHEKGAFTGADNVHEGQFEHAHEGTIFLDEIVNTSEAAQMKMLRVVQEKKLRHLGGKKDIPVNVRIITASNVDLDEAVKTGKLRADLYHRLNEFLINIPPLRSRREDLALLAGQFLMEANLELHKKIKGFSTDAYKLLLDAPWPGNVRELKNVVKRAVLLAEHDTIMPDQITINDNDRFTIPMGASDPPNKSTSMKRKVCEARENIEKQEVIEALRAAGNNKAKAARMLNIDRATLYTKINKYGLSRM